jgi:hypothetical protein
MKDLQSFPPIPEPRRTYAPRVIGSLIVAASLGGLLFARGHRLPAIALWLRDSLLALIHPVLNRSGQHRQLSERCASCH